jgi:ribosomal protein S3AE
MNKQESQKMTERQKIIQFIDAVSSQNYAQANKYLQSTVEDKIAKRIKSATEKPIFK